MKLTVKISLIVFATLFLLYLFCGRVSFAFAQSSTEKEAAEEHFLKAVTLFDQEKYAASLKEFNTSYSLRPHWIILYNMGMCHLELGDKAMAAAQLSSFMEEGGNSIEDSIHKEVTGILSKLKSKLGILRITGDYSNVTLEIDGRVIKEGMKGENVFLTPGLHHVKIMRGDESMLDKEISFESGEEKEIFVVVEGGNTSVKETVSGVEGAEHHGKKAGGGKSTHKLKNAAWVTMGLAALSIVAGSVTGGLAILEKNRMKGEEEEYMTGYGELTLGELEAIEQRRNDHYNRGLTLSIVSSVMFGLAGAAAVASVTLFAVSAKGKKKEKKAGLNVHTDLRSLVIGFSF